MQEQNILHHFCFRSVSLTTKLARYIKILVKWNFETKLNNSKITVH